MATDLYESKTLTDVDVKNAKPPDSGRREMRDAKVPGLVLRITATGSKSWSFTYRVRGEARRLGLGSYPLVPLKDAREKALRALVDVKGGGDPVTERKAEEREKATNGFATCVEDFIEKYAKPHKRRWAETERVLTKIAVPRWKNRPVQEIRRRDVVDLVDDYGKDAPFQANKLRLHLSKMFNWLLEREVVAANPVAGVTSRVKYVPRQRVLTDEEIAAFWRATGREGGAFGDAARFMLATGLRVSNASRLRRSEVDGAWATIAGERMKNGEDFRVPLSSLSQAIIDAQPVVKGAKDPHVFIARGTGEKAINGWSNAAERLRALVNEEAGKTIPEWTLHDLRRTFTSCLGRLSVPTEVIDRLTNHKPPTRSVTAAVYNWHLYNEEAAQAVEKWAGLLATLAAAPKKAKGG